MPGLEDGTLLTKLLGMEDGFELHGLESRVMLGLEDGKVLGKSLGTEDGASLGKRLVLEDVTELMFA